MIDLNPLQALLASLSEGEKRQGKAATITLEDLVAYRQGQLTPAKARAVERAMAMDRRWADLMLELAHFEEEQTGLPEPFLGTDEVDREWRTLEARLENAPRLDTRVHRFVNRRPLLSLAASLAAGAGLMWLVLWSTAAISPLRSDHRTSVITLSPSVQAEPSKRSTRPEIERISLPADTTQLFFEVRPSRLIRNAIFSYQITLGDKVIRYGDAWSEGSHFITFLIDRRGLVNGARYRLRITTMRGEPMVETEFVLGPKTTSHRADER